MISTKNLIDGAKKHLKLFFEKSFIEKCDVVSFCLIFVFFIDCSFSGSGRCFSIGPLSLRMLLGGAALLFAFPKFIINIKKYIKNPIFYLFFGFISFLIFSASKGLIAGNNIEVLTSDIKGFFWLFTVPALVITIDNKKRFDNILNAIVIGAFIQAAIILTIHIVCCVYEKGILFFYQPLLDLKFGMVNVIYDNVFRIFMNSSPYMVLAIGILLFKQIKAERIKPRYIFGLSLLLCCLLLSFTRSIFGCTFVVFCCIILSVCVFYHSKIKILFKSLACLVLATLICIGCMEFIFEASYLSFAISRTFGIQVKPSIMVTIRNIDFKEIFGFGDSSENNDSDKDDDEDDKDDKKEEELQAQKDYLDITDKSDYLRNITKKELKELIVKSPIIGNGLGACSPTRNGPDEYFYYDVLARMGIIGLILYVSPFVYICIFVLKNKAFLADKKSCIALLCGFVGFWVVTWFNPWMNAALGISVYSLSCSIIEVVKNK